MAGGGAEPDALAHVNILATIAGLPGCTMGWFRLDRLRRVRSSEVGVASPWLLSWLFCLDSDGVGGQSRSSFGVQLSLHSRRPPPLPQCWSVRLRQDSNMQSTFPPGQKPHARCIMIQFEGILCFHNASRAKQSKYLSF